MMTNSQGMARYALCAGVFAAAALLAGCASQSGGTGIASGVTVSDPARLSRSGFLSDYGRLKPVSWGDGIECWREPDAPGPIQLASQKPLQHFAPFWVGAFDWLHLADVSV